MKIVDFRSAAELRRWFGRHHASESELWPRFNRKGSGRAGVSYQEAVDVALCFGWIDGVRKKVDDDSYTNRFSPRKPKSIWSAINIRRVGDLKRAGLMAPAGLSAYEGRDPARAGLYSFENRKREFEGAHARRFRAQRAAWKFFQAQPPGYRRLMTFWVTSAKKPETQEKRLGELIAASARGLRVGAPTPKKK